MPRSNYSHRRACQVESEPLQPTTGGILVGGEQDDVIGDQWTQMERDSELDESVQISIWKTGLRRQNGIEE
jgi:hypothetical protein